MKTMQVGNLKTHFSEVIERVKNGEKIVIAYGRSRKNVAVIVPYAEYAGAHSIKLGLLKKKARYTFKKNFPMTTEELAGS